MTRYDYTLILLLVLPAWLMAQIGELTGIVTDHEGQPLPYAEVRISSINKATTSDADGTYRLNELPEGAYLLEATYLSYAPRTEPIVIKEGAQTRLDITMQTATSAIDEVVVTGTMKAVQRSRSPVPVEVYHAAFLKKNPTPNLFEALTNVNGVRPQLNCAVCNTGDIRVNGLEGPNTMVLIDGMPIVSNLATVYGLMGIPNSMIQRIEVVKGPASSLYGSEAIGGLINVITKDPESANSLSLDVMGTTWGEYTADLGAGLKVSDRLSVLTGVNYHHFDQIHDDNDDGFTDMTLTERVSVFQKWQLKRPENRLLQVGVRYLYEDRWGGELDWTPADRGGTEVYGETIQTQRWEAIGQYELPTKLPLMLTISGTGHVQSSTYGDTDYDADQYIGFGQLTYDRQWGRHDMLIGAALRYNYYDDSTPATAEAGENQPDQIWLPGLFVQDEYTWSDAHRTLLGIRYDYNSVHGSLFTPRLAHKWGITPHDILRLNAGTGYRVVNLFTEDHAALTGAREVVLREALDPEQSWNVNINYLKRIYFGRSNSLSLDFSAWYTRFSNQILPNYDTDPNLIIYDNLDGHAVTQGASLSADLSLTSGLSASVGATLMDVQLHEGGDRQRQPLTERFSGTWAISYSTLNRKWTIDYTGTLYSPMLLPTLGPLDPRPDESPWFSLQNIQVTYRGIKDIELYGGIKNLLDWTPWRASDHPIIARAHDPFDRNVVFDDSGQAVSTPENPYALTFDPTYVYGPNQGIRGFVGVRYFMK